MATPTFKLMTNHNLALIKPTFTGNELAGYPYNNARTLNPYTIAKSDANTPGVSYTHTWAFDRTANATAITCGYFAGWNATVSTVNYKVQAADDSGFSTNLTTLLDFDADDQSDPIFFTFTSNTQRYVRLRITDSLGAAIRSVRVFTLGVVRDLGIPQLNEQRSGSSTRPDQVNALGEVVFTSIASGQNTYSRSFKRVITATANAIMDDWVKVFLPDAVDLTIGGIGAGAGSNPSVLAYYSDNSAAVATWSLYGRASVSSREYAANYSEVSVSIRPFTIPPNFE